MEIRDFLKQHEIPVWLDIDNGIKDGNINVAMATGVDGAAAVICLVSEQYQKSKNCQRELNYADDRNLPIFPCLVDEGYTQGFIR